jgi:hypothetical protein
VASSTVCGRKPSIPRLTAANRVQARTIGVTHMKLSSRLRWIAASVAIGLFVMASPAAADPCDNGNHVGNPHCVADPTIGATPELDTAVLFGGGLISVVGYGLLRLRSRRRD